MPVPCLSMVTARLLAHLPHFRTSAQDKSLHVEALHLNLIPTLVCMILLPCRITLRTSRPFSPVSLHLACNNITTPALSLRGRYGRRYRRYSGRPVCRHCCRAGRSTVGRAGRGRQQCGGRGEGPCGTAVLLAGARLCEWVMLPHFPTSTNHTYSHFMHPPCRYAVGAAS